MDSPTACLQLTINTMAVIIIADKTHPAITEFHDALTVGYAVIICWMSCLCPVHVLSVVVLKWLIAIGNPPLPSAIPRKKPDGYAYNKGPLDHDEREKGREGETERDGTEGPIRGEGTNTVELKVAVPRATGMPERLCGMANARGDAVIVGISSSLHEIVGVLDHRTGETLDVVLRAVRHMIKPELVLDPPESEISASALGARARKFGDELLAPFLRRPNCRLGKGNESCIRRGTDLNPFFMQRRHELKKLVNIFKSCPIPRR